MRTTPRVAGFRSEYPAGFELECMAGFVGIRKRERTRADIHDGPEQTSSNQRPDTLMQDR